jgi:hypothetical protein
MSDIGQLERAYRQRGPRLYLLTAQELGRPGDVLGVRAVLREGAINKVMARRH